MKITALDFYKKRLKERGFDENQIKELTEHKELPWIKFAEDYVEAINFTDSCEKLTFKIGENCKIKEFTPVVITERITEFLYKAQKMNGETIIVDNTDLIKISS